MIKLSDQSDFKPVEVEATSEKKTFSRREALSLISKTSTFVVAAGLLPTSWTPVTMVVLAQGTTFPPTTTTAAPRPVSVPAASTLGLVGLAAGLGAALAKYGLKKSEVRPPACDDREEN